MAARSTSEYLKAGVFLLAGLAGGIGIVVALAGGADLFIKKARYTAYFTLADGADGLKPQSLVKLGGQEVGKVDAIDFDGQLAPTAVRVSFVVFEKITLYKDVDVRLDKPLFGSSSTLNIVSVGTAAAGRADVDTKIQGQLAPGLLAQIGVDKKRVEELFKSLEDGMTKLRNVAGEIEKDYPNYRQRIENTLDSIKTTGDNVTKVIEENRASIKSALELFPSIAADAKATSNDVKAAAEKINIAIDENLPKIRTIIADAEAFSGKLNTQYDAKISQALDKFNKGLEEFEKAGGSADKGINEMRATLAELSPDLRHTAGNLRLSSDQLKLVLADVRRNPWKLLYQPGRKELQQDLLFMSARTYAEAVSELRSATTAMEAIAGAGERGNTAIKPEDYIRLKEQIDEAFKRYEGAERELLERLSREGK